MDRNTFTEAELAYLNEGRRLAHIATVGRDGTPHVVPTGWTYNAHTNTIDVSGRDLAHTKKFSDIDTSQRAAIVIDDLASVQPWRPRAIEIRGRAEALREPATLIRIHPEHISSWGLEAV